MSEPSYIRLYESGELDERSSALQEILKECKLCPRKCRVNRLIGEKGFCRSGANAMVSSAGPHFGEESPLVGRYGSGTIFLTNCNLGCVFCQNYDISHGGIGRESSPQEIARLMISLQNIGCHNINFVTPTHYVPQIVESLKLAINDGLKIPLVYNCGGYESVNVIKLLEGIFDIYMPDIKYGDNESASKYSNAPNYFDVVKEVIIEMHRQVGDLYINSKGIAEKGLLIRHLVLPNDLANTKKVMEFIAKVSKGSYVNVMDQYRPRYKVYNYPEINRRINKEEFDKAISFAREAGLSRGFDYE